MTQGTKLNPRKYLKESGFIFDAKPAQLDKRFYKMLSPEDQETVENVWSAAAMGLDISSELYTVPKNLKQACTLFSHDADRYVVSMGWIADLVERTNPTSLVEMGCGAGLLINYLQKRTPHLVLNGIDGAKNLVEIGRSLTNLGLIAGDYLTAEPDGEYEMIVCEFGYDNSNIPPSKKPHSAAQCGLASYCPGCAEDGRTHFREYMAAWRRWGTAGSRLAMVGRMTDYTDIRAVTLAARDVGWYVRLEHSAILRIKDERRGSQKFPAWFFTTEEAGAASEEDIANFYMKGKIVQAPVQ